MDLEREKERERERERERGCGDVCAVAITYIAFQEGAGLISTLKFFVGEFF